jgi:hypothetical protein
MTRFFTVTDNSIYTRGYPWVASLGKGFELTYFCQREKRRIHYATGDMEGTLERNKGTKWADVLGCGSFPFFIVSERVIECWEKESLGIPPMGKLHLIPPYPRRLAAVTSPQYFWIDGRKCRGALMDFDASGYVGVQFCPECGTRSDNIAATCRKQYAQDASFSYVFRPNSWNGHSLFTTDISEAQFFCTEAIVECARKYKLTNFRFIPVEQGDSSRSLGIKYM